MASDGGYIAGLGTGGGDYNALATAGFITSAAGALMSAVGAFYSTRSQQYALRQQALSLDFAQTMANINARSAEADAQSLLEAGRRENAILTFRQGAERAAVRVSQAASGTTAGIGSNAEVLASQRYTQLLDQMTLRANTVRAANAARTRGVSSKIEGLMSGVSAANARGTARSLSPAAASASSLLGSTGTLASQWVWMERYSQRR